MKHKIIATFIVCFCITSFVHAQVTIYIKPALSIANLIYKPIAPYDYNEGTRKPVVGLSLGLQVEHRIWKNLFVTEELMYLKKGTIKLDNKDNSTGQPNYGANLNLNYLELPVLLKWRIKDKFDIGAGPSFSYLFSAKFNNGNVKRNTSSLYKKTDFALHSDIHYKANKKIGIGLRYIIGLNKNILQKDGFDIDPEFVEYIRYNIPGRNQVILSYLTYKF